MIALKHGYTGWRKDLNSVNKQISTERAFRLVQETKDLEENATCFETYRGLNKEREKWTQSNIMGSQCQKENKPEDLGAEKNAVMANPAGEEFKNSANGG